MKPWQDDNKPIRLGNHPHVWYFDSPCDGVTVIEAMEVLEVLEDLQQQIETLQEEVRQAVVRAAMASAAGKAEAAL